MRRTRKAVVVAVSLACVAKASLAADPPAGARVFVSNSNDGDVSVIDASTRTSAVPDAAVGQQPYWLVPSPDGLWVYVANRNGAAAVEGKRRSDAGPRALPGSLPEGTPSVSVIDAASGAAVAEIPLSKGGPTGLAVTPDGSKLFVTCTFDAAVAVVDTATRAETSVIDLGSDSSPEAVTCSPDGSKVFVLSRGAATVVTLDAATGGRVGNPFPVGSGHRDLGISGDGTRLILVGDGETEILDAATGTQVALLPDIGSHRHLGVSGSIAVVSNQAYLDPVVPPAKPADGQSSLDIYDLAAAAYVDSVPLSATNAYGVAIAPGGTYAWVTSKNDGVLMFVDLVNRVEQAPTAPIGNTSRNAAVVVASPEEVVDAFLLPRRLQIRASGSGKDYFKAAGTFDQGSGTFDASNPVTLEVGTFSRQFLLERKGETYRAPKSSGIQFRVRPNRQGSSRGGFRLIIRKIALAGLVPTDGEVPFRFVGPDGHEARGTVVAKGGKYTLGRVKGALADPGFFPAKVQAKLKDGANDKLSIRGGFSTEGAAPTSLGTVRIGLGAYSRTLAGSSFKPKGAKFTFLERVAGSKLKVVIDFARDEATVAASGVELGPLDGETADLVFGNGASDEAFRVRLRLGGTATRKIY